MRSRSTEATREGYEHGARAQPSRKGLICGGFAAPGYVSAKADDACGGARSRCLQGAIEADGGHRAKVIHILRSTKGEMPNLSRILASFTISDEIRAQPRKPRNNSYNIMDCGDVGNARTACMCLIRH
jgi:hypothetical protein